MTVDHFGDPTEAWEPTNAQIIDYLFASHKRRIARPTATRIACGLDPVSAARQIFTDWEIDTPVHQAIFEALGAASVCWSTPEGAGVFDSERATLIGNELLDLLQRKLWTAP